jgi:hypothetical protein
MCAEEAALWLVVIHILVYLYKKLFQSFQIIVHDLHLVLSNLRLVFLRMVSKHELPLSSIRLQRLIIFYTKFVLKA